MNNNDKSTEFDFNIDETQTDEVQHNDAVQENPAPTPNPVRALPQIPGDSAPFIVLCGPPASGKSMVLKSLASYLYQSGLGYTIAANTTLLNTAKYQEDCAYFDSIIGDPDIRMPNTVDYLMADIIDKNGNVVAHFLEAPGEDFFSINNVNQEPNIQFKGYLEKIAQITPDKPRKVIYIILLDLDSTTSLRNNPSLRDKYQKKMTKLYNRFVLNPKAVIEDARQNYPNLFFKSKFLFWNIENYTFLPYCTGSYPDDGSYTASGPAYPTSLWKEITKQLL